RGSGPSAEPGDRGDRRRSSSGSPRRRRLVAARDRGAGHAVVDLAADHELLELRAVLVDLARLVEVDALEERQRAEATEEVGDRLLVDADARELQRPARVGELREPELVGRRRREVGEDAHRADLLRLELADHAELLAELLLLLIDAERLAVRSLERRELLGHAREVAAGAGDADALPEMARDQRQRRKREDERAERQLLAPAGGALGLLDGEQVDPDHLSPGWRVASPTATASAGPLVSISRRSTLRSTWTLRNGSATSTAHPRRCVSCIASPGMRAGPPETMTPPSGS